MERGDDRNQGTAGEETRKPSGRESGGVRLTETENIDYFIGRLVWEGVAKYKEINEWFYSPDELIQMHSFLDLKNAIENRAIKSMDRQNGN